MVEVRPNEIFVTENPTQEQVDDAFNNSENKRIEFMKMEHLTQRMKELQGEMDRAKTAQKEGAKWESL